MALVLNSFLPERCEGKPVYHFAPEAGISELLRVRYDSDYVPADIVPEEYSWSKVPVRKVDLAQPRKYFEKNSVFGFVHSHVLEHIPAPIDLVINQLNEAIVPGGFHLFQVPIEKGWYREDMNPNMPAKEREERFFQFDHIRVFGFEDFSDRCLRLFGDDFSFIDLKDHIPQQTLEEAGVPPSSLSTFNGHSAFLFVKK